MENKLKRIIAAVLVIDVCEIDENSSSNTIETWDSLKQMNLIVAIEESFCIEFDDEETILLDSYNLLLESLKNKLNL